MRDIKFRAWMPKEKKWYKGGAIQLTAMIGNSFGLSEANGKIIELQQYSGLKDKNGVEIYEGDVVRGYDNDGDPTAYIYEVFWNSTNAYFGGKRPANKLLGWDAYEVWFRDGARRYEVIGNIYENPDLLK